jgi:hypothetical protein
MAPRNEGALDRAALGGLRGLAAIVLWTAGALFGTRQLISALPLGYRGFSGAPEFDRRLAAWSASGMTERWLLEDSQRADASQSR